MKYKDVKAGIKIKMNSTANGWDDLSPDKEYEVFSGADGFYILDEFSCIRCVSRWDADYFSEWDVVEEPREERSKIEQTINQLVSSFENKDTGPVKSDGGSSSYYDVTVVRASDGQKFECQMGDIIASVYDNDFIVGNIVKACRRAILAKKGIGKEGTSIVYDMNKVSYFAEDFKQRYGEK